MTTVTYNTLKLSNGVNLFYLEAGLSTKPTLLLLHGFPTSSRQFQKLIPLLAPHFFIYAPDLPGFGQTRVEDVNYEYTFANMSKSIELFIEAKHIEKYSVYVFDYGSPTAFRVATGQPKGANKVTAIISQNGNAYEEGLGEEFWAPLRTLWNIEDKRIATGSVDAKDQEIFDGIVSVVGAEALSIEGFVDQYTSGEPDQSRVNPEFGLVDYLTLQQIENNGAQQLAYFLDYRNNVKLYPKFQQFLRESRVPVLAVWGKNDFFFPEAGADAYKKDAKDVKVVKLDGGHFASLTHSAEVANAIIDFFSERGIIQK